jgi:hypothetical protein
VGVTLAQHAVDDKTNEITAVETLLGQLVLEGRMVTMDALLTQRHVAQTIVDKDGDYVMSVKDNQLTGCKFSREPTLFSLALVDVQNKGRVLCRQKNAR